MDCVPGACGCCAGIDVETPGRIDNLPGQSTIRYRTGVHATFKGSLLARLSSTDAVALSGLRTRDDADFTVALCDALATTLDVLGFYQERVANENYLRTATERKSMMELAALIGYEPAPGCAASSYLAFTLQSPSGGAAVPMTIPSGTRVQSVPGPGETAQSFETVEDITASADWSAIPVQTSIPWTPTFGDMDLYLAGVNHNLAAGDVILIVGDERRDTRGSERWDVRLLTGVEQDVPSLRTRLRWASGLGADTPGHVDPSQDGPRVYVFRQRAPLFGHNAPDPRLLKVTDSHLVNSTQDQWLNFALNSSQIDLDAAYPKVVPGSWFALVSNEGSINRSGLSGYIELCNAKAVSFPSRSNYGLSGKVTRLIPDLLEHAAKFTSLRDTLVLAQSDELPTTGRPLFRPLYGGTLALGRVVSGLSPGQALAVSGKRARIRLRVGAEDTPFQLSSGGTRTAQAGDSFRMLAAPEQPSGAAWSAIDPAAFEALMLAGGSTSLRLTLMDRDGEKSQVEAKAEIFELAPPDEADEVVSEIAFVRDQLGSVTSDRDRTTLTLAAPLANCYDLASARVCANVAHATHGETVVEILGNGDMRLPNATFPLRQSPLTYVSASTPSGRASTVLLRVNDLEWKEVPSLFDRAPTDRVYELSQDDKARTTVRFGDGVEGARPPSGDHNIRGTYRKGLGLAGNVSAGTLTTLLSRPLGVTGVTNPEAATGGEDAESEDRMRDNAPLVVLTLDRAVSILDYQDYARAFAGIAKAHALWIPSGPGRGVFITIAGETGAVVPEDGDTYRNLLASLRSHGDPLLPLRLRNYRSGSFGVNVAVKIAADADPTVVLPTVRSRLTDAFSFEARRFGQMVSTDEVGAIAQLAPGVVAVQVTNLRRDGAAAPRLFAELPVASPDAIPEAAELLTLDADRLEVNLMP